MKNVLLWFRNDLRLLDNEALYQAAKKGNVVPVYIIDIRQFAPTTLGFKRTGKFRAQFLLQTLRDLKKNLKEHKSDLIVKIGIPEIEIIDIIKRYNINLVVASKDSTQEETDVETAISTKLKSLNVDFDLYWGKTLIHVRDLPFQIKYLPEVFTNFRKKIENFWKIRPTFEIPTPLNFEPLTIDATEIPTLKDLDFEEFETDSRDANNFIGGETLALARLKEFIWDKKLIINYKTTRCNLLGKDFSSKLSPYISLGCISPRTIYEEIRKFEKEFGSNQSTHWLIIELLWRDYYHFISLKFGIRLFKRCGIKHDFTKKWKKNRKQFELWKNGNTGIPIVDACMAELKITGYISNRARQISSSYLAKDLGIEWWWGAVYFESQLIDYEVCNNWGNWNYIAGIGTDPNADRYINPMLQAQKYDPDAQFIKYWLPDLAQHSNLDLITNRILS